MQTRAPAQEPTQQATLAAAQTAPVPEKHTFSIQDAGPQATTLQRHQNMAGDSPRHTELECTRAMLTASPAAQRLQSMQAMTIQSPIVTAQRHTGNLMYAKPMQRMESNGALQAKNSFHSNQEPAQIGGASEAPRPNNSGLPDKLKSGIENLSGINMDHVKVHYNSDKPAQLQAHAYAKGDEIHIAPGQEKHLPHEAWHVVQQAQGRVRPTAQMKGDVQLNDNAGLEREADEMGSRANSLSRIENEKMRRTHGKGKSVFQLMGVQIVWGKQDDETIATKVKTTRQGHADGNHTTAHVVFRKIIEKAIQGNTYKVACATIKNRFDELKGYPGYEDATMGNKIQFPAHEKEFDLALTAALADEIPQNHTYHLTNLATKYEDFRHRLNYTYREGITGGIGISGATDEGDNASKYVDEVSVGDGQGWLAPAANLLDTRDWKMLYKTLSFAALKSTIVQHFLSLNILNKIPLNYWRDLVKELLYRMNLDVALVLDATNEIMNRFVAITGLDPDSDFEDEQDDDDDDEPEEESKENHSNSKDGSGASMDTSQEEIH